MKRAVVCVATTPHYINGLQRLSKVMNGPLGESSKAWIATPHEMMQWPSHQDKPYAFKAYALQAAAQTSDVLLWADASILPIRSLEPLWEKIERYGYWIARNGWNNYQWTADSAYPDLFPEFYGHPARDAEVLRASRTINQSIPHVVATSFGLNVKHPIGKAFLAEYYRLASETKAFCGPWMNAESYPGESRPREDHRIATCGPADVLGHRHDQTAASVIAWRLGMKLTDCPEIFAYSKRRQDGTLHLSDQDERTILLADGSLHDGVVL